MAHSSRRATGRWRGAERLLAATAPRRGSRRLAGTDTAHATSPIAAHVTSPCATIPCRRLRGVAHDAVVQYAAHDADGGRTGSGRAGYSATKAGVAEEMGRYRRLLSNGSWDAVVIQCPLWHFIEKGAYDATLTSVARRAAVRQRTALPADDGAAALSGFGAACARYVHLARRQQPAARIFLLGHFARAAKFKKAGNAAPDTRARLPSWRLPAHGPCLTSVGPSAAGTARDRAAVRRGEPALRAAACGKAAYRPRHRLSVARRRL